MNTNPQWVVTPREREQSWDPSVDCESFVLYLQPYVALRRLSIQQSQGQDVPTSPDESSGSSGAWLVSSFLQPLINSKGHQWKSAEVTLRSQHHSFPPSKQRSRFRALAEQHLRYVRSALFLWWMQQCITYSDCVCSLRYPAYNVQAPYCHLGPLRLYYILPHYPINDSTIEK